MPAAITRSSHACSASRRTRRPSHQDAGWNQYIATASSATSRAGQSARLTCASSWRRTTRLRSTAHERAACPIRSRGRRQPDVTATGMASDSTRGTGRASSSRCAAASRSSIHSASRSGEAPRAMRRMRAQPTASRAANARAPSIHSPAVSPRTVAADGSRRRRVGVGAPARERVDDSAGDGGVSLGNDARHAPPRLRRGDRRRGDDLHRDRVVRPRSGQRRLRGCGPARPRTAAGPGAGAPEPAAAPASAPAGAARPRARRFRRGAASRRSPGGARRAVPPSRRRRASP